MSIVQTLNQKLSSLGTTGILAIGIMIACVVYFDQAIHPLQQQLMERQQLVDEQSVKTIAKADWLLLHDNLPSLETADELAVTVYRLADDAHIALREAEFKEEKLDKAHMVARHFNIVASGDYFQVRQFLSSTLAEIPAMALDNVTFQKSRDKTGQLDVRIAMTLYLAKR